MSQESKFLERAIKGKWTGRNEAKKACVATMELFVQCDIGWDTAHNLVARKKIFQIVVRCARNIFKCDTAHR